MPDHISDNKRRAAGLVAAVTLVLAVVLGLIGLAVLSWIGLVLGIVIAAVVVWTFVRRATALVVTRTGGEPADETRHARFHNVVEGLCVAGGLPKPELLVLDDDALNALACGRNPRDASVLVTSGLLGGLSRIELEGVLAHELSHVKSLDILPDTLAAAIPGGRWLTRRYRADAVYEALADQQAVGMTRYPPGLLSALEKLDADTTPMRPHSASITHLWLKSPETVQGAASPLAERIEALKEL